MKCLFRLVLLSTLTILGAGALFIFGVGYYLSPQDELTSADAIVVISGGETRARVREASRLYREGYAPKVVYSGAARAGDVSNALSMSRWAAEDGVPAEAGILEEKSETTRENAERVAQVVAEQGFKSIILVTSPYHQRRARGEFERALGE